MSKALERGKRSPDSSLDITIAMYGDMLLGKVASAQDIACPEHLERTALDFSAGSLLAIDRYLNQVRTLQDGLVDVTYLNTIVAVACYVGEVIRRGSPEGDCHWLRSPPGARDDTHTSLNLGNFADIMLITKSSDQPFALTRMVAAILSTKGPNESTYEYALQAVKGIWQAAAALQT